MNGRRPPARSAEDVATPRVWVERIRTRVRDRAVAQPRTWWVLLALGAISVAVGIAMLVWPALALHTIALVIGAWLVAAGLTRLVAALLDRSPPRERQRLSALVGVVCVGAGLGCLARPHLTLGLLAVVLALQWLVGGVVDIVTGLRGAKAERRWLVALGAVSCLAGAVFAVWPAVSLLTFNVLTAAGAIGVGLLDVTAGLRLRRRSGHA
jgi:uncharacterized membrane protein HdeD (DUF308 family)